MGKGERGRALTRQKILEGALQLIDREGLTGFNMRKLGMELGVEAMSLYNHIAGKDDVLDGVIELLMLQAASLPTQGQAPRDELWSFAHAYRAVLLSHPRALPLVATRQLRTEAALGILDRLLTTLQRASVTGVQAIFAVNSLAGFITGHALFEVGEGQEDEASLPWKTLSAHRYPGLHAAMVDFDQWSADSEFDFGLQALLQSILPPE